MTVEAAAVAAAVSTFSAAVASPTATSVEQQAGRYGGIFSQTDALREVEALFKRQIERAGAQSAAINTPVDGDAEAKTAFHVLIDVDAQRTLFIQQCRKQSFWPRVRTLVGSPPFSFLLPEDNELLNPGGITANRVNMALAERASIPSSGEIGSGHFEDESKRKYRVVAVDRGAFEGMAVFRRLASGRHAVLDLKLARASAKHRVQQLQRNESAEAAAESRFPIAGERVRLKLNRLLRSGQDDAAVVVSVKAVKRRSRTSPIARVFCTVE